MVCKDCEGTGKLGLQREDCFYCGGSGYVLEKVILNKKKVEEGLEELVQRLLKIRERLNKSSAYTEGECEERLRLIKERDYLDNILHYLFNLQTRAESPLL